MSSHHSHNPHSYKLSPDDLLHTLKYEKHHHKWLSLIFNYELQATCSELFSNSALCLLLPFGKVPRQAISISRPESTTTAPHCVPAARRGPEHSIFHAAPEHRSHEVTPLLKPSDGTPRPSDQVQTPWRDFQVLQTLFSCHCFPAWCNHHHLLKAAQLPRPGLFS